MGPVRAKPDSESERDGGGGLTPARPADCTKYIKHTGTSSAPGVSSRDETYIRWCHSISKYEPEVEGLE